MIEFETEDSKSRRKRPERQFYVPPAQRRSSLNDSTNIQTQIKCKNHISNKKEKVTVKMKKRNSLKNNNISETDNLNKTYSNVQTNIPFFEFLFLHFAIQSKSIFSISDTTLEYQSKYDFNVYENHNNLIKIPVICFSAPFDFNLLQGNSETQIDNFFDEKSFPFYCTKFNFSFLNLSKGVLCAIDNLCDSYSNLMKRFYIFCDVDMFKMRNSLFIEKSYKQYLCLDFVLEHLILDKQSSCIFDIADNTTNSSIKIDNASASVTNSSCKSKDPILNLHIKKTTLHNENSLRKVGSDSTNHEQEIEIMRKTKEHINRKTRPIMKYVGEKNDTLNIGTDSLTSWEDLLDDEGELKEELLKVDNSTKPAQNSFVGKESSEVIVEDFKHIEELEHMVELYDFPSTFKTQDLIQAFSNIDCDGMYVKWVDSTHAILVLGTLTQAVKATNTNNPLIKVRLMAAASRVSLAVAYKNDLKPAMKRPQTNLQTARRFITAALGTKIGVSKERMAKEREDLKVAREIKKMTRQNERDAWEGNLQSSLH